MGKKATKEVIMRGESHEAKDKFNQFRFDYGQREDL